MPEYDFQKDAYETLGVPTDAQEEDITWAYRRKVRDFHPDVNESEESHQTTVDLNAAYEQLIRNGVEGRAEYDRERAEYLKRSAGTGDSEGRRPESDQQRAEHLKRSAGTGDSEGRRPESGQSDSEAADACKGLCALAGGLVIVFLFYTVLLPLSMDKLMGWDTYPRDGIDPIDWVLRWF